MWAKDFVVKWAKSIGLLDNNVMVALLFPFLAQFAASPRNTTQFSEKLFPNRPRIWRPIRLAEGFDGTCRATVDELIDIRIVAVIQIGNRTFPADFTPM